MTKMRGSIVALITPMTPSGAVDQQALQRLVDFHVAAGTVALVSVGTTGESATLGEAEHCEVIARTVEMAAGRIPVIAGTGANSTTEAIRLTRCAKDAGADAALLVTPYYNKPTQEGLYQHHKAVAEAVELPQFLYNVPGRTACDLQPETAARLSEVSNIVGLKEATGDLSRVGRLRALCGADFLLYSGDDGTCCEFMLAGGDGVISVTSNLVPDRMQAMCAAALAGDAGLARALNTALDPLHQGLFVESNPIPVKWALAEMGLCQPGIRLPLTWLSASHHDRLRASLRELNCIAA
ncbi:MULTISPECIES: 4-hydroxy-tetrahydrodipicolinate synthase [Thiorhodovibrio]|uniref:4-hydroxy-tetrahydrodipicolinate synthase n=1 Tax=Thiorhodovibrio TaxID=61593 RepID=UPI00191421D8|nr:MULTISPECIES: 4-hydroxy-tetrahydrodipicolinate synthase [Thiorhodovibrio]MBK5968262.1 4-hydroxy-tetrahydrodipicolinate synthase [Thiorhodovibrio winogradskyi]WPL13034.1 4-hydroxy-tetrahydrodipicolinate synthase [Thiorhodovibrio litoralis]